MTVRRSISRIFADRAAHASDEIVVVTEDGVLTAARLDVAASVIARQLIDGGVDVDDLVTVTLPNGIPFVVACAAVWRAGATPQPASGGLTPDERATLETVARPAAAIGQRPQTSGIAWISESRIAAALLSDKRPPVPDLAASSWKAPATSGSTGTPKVVRATAPALLDPTRPVAAFIPFRAVQLVAGPLTHSAVFTYAFRGLMTGHRLVIMPRFDECAWLDAVERHGVTWGLLVPTMMHRLLRVPDSVRSPDRVRTVESLLHMGAPCDPDLKRAFLDWIGAERVVEVYAGSESNGLTMIRGDEWRTHPGSVGRPIGGTEIAIRHADGTAAAIGEVGVVWMRRGDTPTYEYLGASSRRDPDGWDTLNDLGRLDEHGYLHLVDRADDVINRGGEKIHPAEIERVLERHPDIRSAIAFGIPDAEMGARVAAAVDIADREITAAELIAWVRPRLGSRAPERFIVVHEPVRDDAGKARRHLWREHYDDVEATRR